MFLSVCIISSLTWASLLSGFVSLFICSLDLHCHSLFPSPPSCPLYLLDSMGSYKIWPKCEISESLHWKVPDWPSASFLQLTFSLSIMSSDLTMQPFVDFISSNCCLLLQSRKASGAIWLVCSAVMMAHSQQRPVLLLILSWHSHAGLLRRCMFLVLGMNTGAEMLNEGIYLLNSTMHQQLSYLQKPGSRP